MNPKIPFIDLLSNPFKMQNKNSVKPKIVKPEIVEDDNEEILRLLKERLALGKQRYGHGVIVDDNTTKYGTNQNDWHLMAEEEILDGLVYLAASIIRIRRRRKMVNNKKTMDDFHIKYQI